MKRITVFCGSSNGFDEVYRNEAIILGKIMAEQGIELVYGGAKIGVMGAVAEGVLAAGGKAIGVIPDFLMTKEVAHDHLTELIVVPSMHERKMKMHELSDGIIALSGGFGTLEEYFETLTWSQLGLHEKPMGIVNTGGYYDHLITFIDSMLSAGFISPVHRSMILVDNNPDHLLQLMSSYKSPLVKKWIRSDEI